MRVAVIVTARPSWAKLEPVCRALSAKPEIDLQIIACASALLERYGRVVDVIRKDYAIAEEVWSTVEGNTLLTSAKETGALLEGVAAALYRLQPERGVVCADRHEVLGAAQAASYLHLPVVHLQGGERTGSIDDRVRDSITALSDIHCVCTEQARHRVYGLTGHWERIFNTGCPSIDMAIRDGDQTVTMEELGGAGQTFDLSQPFLLVLQHPVTNEAAQAEAQMHETLQATRHIRLPVLAMWPGQDAGSDGISKAIRAHKEAHPEQVVHTVRNLPPQRFLKLLTQCAVLIGNSSCGIRECSYLGTPVVDVGTRQFGRERAANVLTGPHDREWITHAIQHQWTQGFYPSSTLYGSGNAGEQIAEVIAHVGVSDRAGAGR